MPELKVYQSLWAMDGLPDVDLDHNVEGALDRIVAAGFDGVGVNLMRTARAEATARRMAEAGLSWEAQALVHDPDQLARYLDQAIALGAASHVNIQVANVAASVGEAIDLMASLLLVSKGCPTPVFYETHRGRVLNDLFWTVDILDALPDLTLTGDLSHYVTAHEMDLPPAPHLVERIDRVLARCGAFHLRIAGPNQVQLPVEAATSADWRAVFEGWWGQGIGHWRARVGAGDVLPILCELGPPPYAITDPDGRELTDRWAEALALKAMIKHLFSPPL
jgi:sugar phosphate isomerase/epimerase